MQDGNTERLGADRVQVFSSDLDKSLFDDATGMGTSPIDAADNDAVRAYFAAFERIDVLVHAVGNVHQGTIEECSSEDWHRSRAQLNSRPSLVFMKGRWRFLRGVSQLGDWGQQKRLRQWLRSWPQMTRHCSPGRPFSRMGALRSNPIRGRLLPGRFTPCQCREPIGNRQHQRGDHQQPQNRSEWPNRAQITSGARGRLVDQLPYHQDQYEHD
jgi:hypothetical protein